MTPKLSVIVTTHRRPEMCRRAVESVLEQMVDVALECVVVVDGDGISPSLPTDERLTIVPLEHNLGPAGARNAGVSASTGEIVAFLDDDDRYLPHRLARALQAHQRAAVVSCWARTAHAEPRPGPHLEGDVHDTILDRMPPSVGATSVRRDVLVPFDATYRSCEDIDWWIRQTKVAPVATVSSHDLEVGVHTGPRELTGPVSRLEDALRLLEEHASYFEAHPRAHAARLFRAALSADQLGRPGLALQLLLRSYRSVRDPRLLLHAVRVTIRAARLRLLEGIGRASTSELRSILRAEEVAAGRVLPSLRPDPILRFQRLLRENEWLDHSTPGIFGRLARGLWRLGLHRAAVRTGFTFPRHVAAPGLALVHRGTVVVTPRASIGRDCRIHQNVTIAQRGGRGPTIGDGVWIGPGAVIVGDVQVGDGAAIGANAVVTRDVAPWSTVVGVPARPVVR